MTVINKSALLPYSAAKMFELVDDIPSYPEFLPWCRTAEEIERDRDEVTARLELAYGSLHKVFTTRNRLQQNKMIAMRLVEGPFRHLEGFWRFEALDENACKVSLDMEFEFASRLVGMAAGPVFGQIANNLVDAFSKRAVDVYGRA
jgi:ribosome-associated toxin RatA of RatAB toxin-antitoxin module